MAARTEARCFWLFDSSTGEITDLPFDTKGHNVIEFDMPQMAAAEERRAQIEAMESIDAQFLADPNAHELTIENLHKAALLKLLISARMKCEC